MGYADPSISSQLDSMRETFAQAGAAPELMFEIAGEWPAIVSSIRLNSGAAQRPDLDLFDLFMPTRSVTLIELSGNRRKQFEYRAGIVAFVPPHERLAIKWDGVLEGMSLLIEPATLRKAAIELMHEEPDNLSWRIAFSDHAPAIAFLGLDIVSQVMTAYPCGPAHVELQMRALLAMLLRRYASSPNRDTAAVGMRSQHVQRTVRYIKANLRGALTIEGICEMNAVSMTHLNRLFRAELGTSVWSYVQRVRLHAAVEQLLAGAASIDAIAKDCGFHNRAHLTRVVRANYGIPPTVMRRQRAPQG